MLHVTLECAQNYNISCLRQPRSIVKEIASTYAAFQLHFDANDKKGPSLSLHVFLG